MRTQQALHDSEINSTISAMFDGAWSVSIGDQHNGIAGSELVGSLEEAESWLDRKAVELFPASAYASQRRSPPR